MSKPIWKLSTPEQKTVLMTILMSVNHAEESWEWKGKPFTCKPGQMITSLEELEKKCGKGISVQNVRTAINRFEKLGFLTNESTKTGRLITIVNWGLYQSFDSVDTQSDQQSVNKALTKSQQRPNKDLTTNKNDKNIKNEKKNNICPPEPDERKKDFQAIYNLYPKKVGKTKAYDNYLLWLKGKDVNGKKVKLTNRQIQTAVQSYVDQQKAQKTDLKYYKGFDTLMGKQLLDYVEEETSEQSGTDSSGEDDLMEKYRKGELGIQFDGFGDM